MADVIATIRKYVPDAGKSTASAVASILNTPSVEHRNTNRVTAADMLARFGVEKVMAWNAAIGKNGGALLVQSVAATGLDFSHPETVKTIRMFQQSGAIDQATADEILSLGTWYTSPWNEEGGDGQVSEQDVADALAVIAKQDAIAALQQRLNVAMISASNVLGQGGTWDDAVAEIAKG